VTRPSCPECNAEIPSLPVTINGPLRIFTNGIELLADAEWRWSSDEGAELHLTSRGY